MINFSPTDRTLDRRRWLSVSALAAASLAAGCPAPTETADDAAEEITSTSRVPLRLLMIGDPQVAENIKRGWASVSSQELDITRIDGADRQTVIDVEGLVQAAATSDILWIPQLLLADLVNAKRVDPLRSQAVQTSLKSMFPSLRTGITQFNAQTYCLPLGPAVPSIMSTDPIDAPRTWDQYKTLVDQQWDGKAAEPTAPGWAGMMFLWRCSGEVERWLFDPKTFDPLIDTPAYVAVLKQMTSTCSVYQDKSLTAEQIYSRISVGELKGGIGFPTSAGSGESTISTICRLPSGATKIETDRRADQNAFDVMSPVLAISSSCRQTSASKTFINWIVGGPGSENTRGNIPSIYSNWATNVRSEHSADQKLYQPVRSEVLSDSLSRPSMTILRATDYYRSLDEAVRESLAEKTSPSDALASVNAKWSQLTQQIGRDAQVKTWLRSIGLSS